MKRCFAVVLALVMLGLCACGSDQNTAPYQTTETAPMEEVDAMCKDLTAEFVAAPGGELPEEVTCTIRTKDIPEYKTGHLLLVTLNVRSKSNCRKLTVTLFQDDTRAEDTYFVTQDASRITLCFDPDAMPAGIRLAAQDGILLDRITLENKKKTDISMLSHQLGQFALADLGVNLPENGTGAGRSVALIQSENYVYAIGEGALTVMDIGQTPKVLGRVDGLGITRQIALCPGGKAVMVTTRGGGAAVIDVSDPEAPHIRAWYDTLEMATGICISGQYAYICNRQYGVEVVDLSDLDAPQYVRTIQTGEVQSAFVYDGILYCGLYGEHRVDLYDLSASDPVKVGSVDLSGRGDGLTVTEQNGRTVLYAATGHHSAPGLANNTPLTDPRYGQGNGLDIVDVTNPAAPRWLSTVRADGRFYHTGYDYWTVTLSEADGHHFAILSATYNGLYVYNVDDPASPKRVSHVTVPITKESENYSSYQSSSRTLVFPFAQKKQIVSPIVGAVCRNGVVYMAGALTDVHSLPLSGLGNGKTTPGTTLQISPEERDPQNRYSTDGQVHTVITDGVSLYAACGSGGIALLTPSLEEKAVYPTKGICYDLQLQGGVLYAAEGREGLAAYDKATMAELWRYAPAGKVIKQVRLSPKGRFALLHSGDTEASVVRLEDLVAVYSKRTNSQMYHHNLSNLIAGRYLCFWGNTTNEIWLDFGAEDDLAAPIERKEYTSRTSMTGGIAALGGMALNMTGNGYLLYDPIAVSDMKAQEVFSIGGTGKPAVQGSCLAVAQRTSGKVWIVDISSPSTPQLLKQMQVSGNPDIPLIAFGAVYLPAGHGGLIRIPLP